MLLDYQNIPYRIIDIPELMSSHPEYTVGQALNYLLL
jgi:hypothetical protein